MENRDWMYVALCLVVPVLWGVVSSYLYDWCHERLKRERRATPGAPAVGDDVDMYYI